MSAQNGLVWRTTRWNYGEFCLQRGSSSFYCYTLILSATRQNFFHFRACCVNAEFHSLHIGNATKTPLCSSGASFCLLFHYFLQLVLKLKMGQHFNTIPSKCLYIYTLMPGRFEELVLSEITGWLMLPSTCHWNWCKQICCKNPALRKNSAELTVFLSTFGWNTLNVLITEIISISHLSALWNLHDFCSNLQ